MKRRAIGPALFGLGLSTVVAWAQSPQLQIDNLENQFLQLSWPDDRIGVHLEESPDLQNFTAVTELPDLFDNRAWLTVPIVEDSHFFRLRETYELTLNLNEGPLIQAGEEMVLTSSMLAVSNPQTAGDDIVYHVANEGFTSMQSGYIAFGTMPGLPIATFTQADLDAGRVVYRDGFNGIILPEVVADVVDFRVSDSQGGASRPRSFLVLRKPLGAGPDDDAMLWSAGDGDHFLDGGVGEDALVLRGSDGPESVVVAPSADGTQIVLTINGTETVTLDGTEDLHFIMGHGENILLMDGDFSRTDLSPSTVYYLGGRGYDEPAISYGGDIVVDLGEGDNTFVRSSARATFVTGGSRGDTLGYSGQPGFKHRLFPGGSPTVTRGGVNDAATLFHGLNIHIEDYLGSSNVLYGASPICRLDLTLIQDMYLDPLFLSPGEETLGALIIHRDQPRAVDYIARGMPGDSGPLGHLVHDPVPRSSLERQLQWLSQREDFLNDRIADPIPPNSFQIPPVDSHLTADPFARNAVIGEPVGLGREVITGADFDDVLFAGENPLVTDNELPVQIGPDGDTLNGMDGDDWMIGDRLGNIMDGGPGDDRMEGRRGDDTFPWSDGIDAIDGGEGFDVADYSLYPAAFGEGIRVSHDGDGRYRVLYAGEATIKDTLIDVEEIRGSQLDDEMRGASTPAPNTDDRFLGGVGNDYLHGAHGNDHLDGGNDDDVLEGVWGNDVLLGGSGNDTLDGGPDQDELDGGPGNDLGLFRLGETGSESDIYDGGSGIDTLRIRLGASLAGAEAADLVDMLAYFAAGAGAQRQFPALKLTLTGWEVLEIVDRLGHPVDSGAIAPQPPTDITLSRLEVEEEAAGVFVGTLSVDDPNNAVGDEHTFDFSDARFEVRNENEVHLVAGTALDFESEQVVNLTIGATDLSGRRIERPFSIQVLDLPDTPLAPTDLRLSNSSVMEERAGQAVGFVEVDDPNPFESHSFTLSDARFEVVDSILTLTAGTSLDFEAAASLPLDITVEDKDGLTLTRSFTISVNDIDENATAPTLPESHFFTDGSNGFNFTAFGDGRPGLSVASAGDLTGDTVEDLITTSAVMNSPISLANFSFLIPGTATPFPNPLVQSQLAGRGGTVFQLPLIEDATRAGAAAGIGDFNGDGRDDLALSSGLGDLYVVLGRLGGLPGFIDLTNSSTFDGITAFKIEGNPVANRLGATIVAAGDIDGDGFDDLMAGFGTEIGGDGGALILYGSGAVFPPSQDMDSISGLRYSLIDSGAAAPIGDINADGYHDLFVSLPEPGQAVILFGNADGFPAQISPQIDPDVLITGGTNRGLPADHGIAGPAGDINSDGIEDFYLLTQAAGASLGTGNELLVFYGGTSFDPIINLGDNNGGPGGVSFIPYLGGGARGVQLVAGGDFGRLSQADPSFATGVTGGGDLNGDGNSDLLLRVTNTANQQTEHAVVFGSPLLPERLVLDPATLSAPKGIALGFPVATAGYRFDQGLCATVDLNGDGYDEIALANPDADIGFGNLLSQINVLFGGDLTGAVTHQGSSGDDFLLGGRLTDDLLVGAAGNDTLVGKGGRDVYRGGPGDDLLVISGNGIPEFVRLDGGNGTDTVRLDGPRLTWDLSKAGNSNLNPAGNHIVQSIEVIDLVRNGTSGRHVLFMAPDDLADLPGESRALTVIGDEFDAFHFSGSLTLNRTEMRQGLEFRIFEIDALPGFELAVGTDITLN